MSRLTIDMTDQQYQSLKAQAALKGQTIRQYVLERLFPDNPGTDPAWQELKNFLGARVQEGLDNKGSSKNVSTIRGKKPGGKRA